MGIVLGIVIWVLYCLSLYIIWALYWALVMCYYYKLYCLSPCTANHDIKVHYCHDSGPIMTQGLSTILLV